MIRRFTKGALLASAIATGAAFGMQAKVATASDPFIAEIIFFGGNFAPRGWALCDGQLLPIAQNTALFSILGTTYGGDGRTNFGLPDMRGRSPVHQGTGPGLARVNLGQKGGNATTILTAQNLPSHNHALLNNASTATATAAVPATNSVPGNLGRVRAYNASAPDVRMGPATTGNTGSNTSFSNRSPYVAVNCIIALVGTFPSRN